MVKKNTCIFISGNGTNLKNLILQTRNCNFPINIRLVISDKRSALGIKYAKLHSIPYVFIDSKIRNNDIYVIQILKKYRIKFVCLAGYMKILTKKFLREFDNKIINIHPSLLPKFKGLNTYSRVLIKKERKTGCTVHYVNEKLDSGKIILKKSFFVNSDDDEKSLKRKTQILEYKAFPEAIVKIFRYN